MNAKLKPSAKRKNILICRSRTADFPEQQAMLGIRRFALTQPEWRLGQLHVSNLTDNILKDVLAWNPDGVLVVTPFSRLPELSRWNHLPMMVVDIRHQHPEGVSRVELDAHQAGGRAAVYFLRNGFQHFAVALWHGNPPFSRLLQEGFTNRLEEEGRAPACFQTDEGAGRPWHRNPNLDAWLLDLPKPTGLFCVSDATALRVMEHCDRLNINTPSQISILSSGNDPSLCETTRPSISSMNVNPETMGYRAATLLNEQFRSASADPICEMIEPGEVVERQSSNLRAIDDPAIAKAADFLLEHVAQGASLDDAAREAGINRRKLERGFKRHLGVTPGEYLRRLTLDYAKRLITETDLRMNEVAHACDMAPEHFSTLFRKETGRTPAEFKKEKTRGVNIESDSQGE
jgi:LacI family transcriptional regulator